jgi:SAM-dependent methyltransferase
MVQHNPLVLSGVASPTNQRKALKVHQRIMRRLREEGLMGLFRAALRHARGGHLPHFKLTVDTLRGQIGIEIGGPSEPVFGRGQLLPVYAVARRIDNCNFSPSTIWEGSIQQGNTFRFDPLNKPGRQFVCEATEIRAAVSDTYDFLLSSHTIEHLANPIGALEEWKRVLKVGATLILIVPHRDATFDHRRPITPLAHLIDDYNRSTGEDDMTHYEEIVSLHDRSMDIHSGDADYFQRRSLDNLRNRCFHHHVFDTRSFIALLDRGGLQLQLVRPQRPNHIIAVATTLAAGTDPDNHRFLARDAAFLRRSPFRSDRCA